MRHRFDTPVVVVLFNRPDRLEELLAVLREIRPSRLLAIADGPRSGCPEDETNCRASRALLRSIDWPCTIERDFADENLGCDRRVTSGLDWAFSLVERAVVFEDDILPDPSFLEWAQRILDRFGEDEDFAMASGHNPLGRWGRAGADHLRASQGSIWGWASTSEAWRRIRSVDLSGPPAQARDDVADLGLDPLVQEHYALALQAWREWDGAAWDTTFALRRMLRGDVAFTSSVNLTRNTGFGSGATRTSFLHDFNALLPAQSAVRGLGPVVESDDPSFDRASLMVQLLGRCVDPPMALRLATLLAAGSPLPIDPGARNHLAPFTTPDEAVELLDHLAGQGVSSTLFEHLRDVLRRAVETTAR